MHIVQPPEWNTPELLQTAQNLFTSRLRDTKVGYLAIDYPHYASYVDPEGNTLYGEYGHRFKTPKCMVVNINDYPAHLAHVCLMDFVSHCGIIAVSHIYARSGLESLWMSTIEDYCQYLGFSTIIGGDGESSGNLTHNFIKTHGVNWEIKDMGVNRRMRRSQSIFWKQLPVKRILNINWWKGKNKPDAQQIATAGRTPNIST